MENEFINADDKAYRIAIVSGGIELSKINAKVFIDDLEKERDSKIAEIRKEYQKKIYDTLIKQWDLKEGITKLRYISDRDGYIEGIFKGLSENLKITIETYSCNGFECDGDTTASYENFINRW